VGSRAGADISKKSENPSLCRDSNLPSKEGEGRKHKEAVDNNTAACIRMMTVV